MSINMTDQPADTVTPSLLDWRGGKIGPLAPCRYCRRKALMRDQEGRPCHKVCAERRLV